MTAENKKQIWQSVLASVVVAAVINGFAFMMSFSRMSVIVEHLALRVDAIEQDYEQYKRESSVVMQELQLSLVRIQDGLDAIRGDVREISIDHKAMMRGQADGDETVTRKEYTRKKKSS